MNQHPHTTRHWVLGTTLSTVVASALALALTTPAWSATSPNLGVAAAASVVAGTTVTNTGPTTLSGGLDLFPGTSVTGFPPGVIGGTENTGTLNATESSAAMTAVTAAYGQLASAPATGSANTDLAGLSFGPGVYSASSGLSLTGTVTLVGDANSVFIFQSASTLITGPSSRVVLSGGVSACNVWWQVGSSATLATSTAFAGNILALTSISLATGVTLQGRALAQTGGVTLDSDIINSTCSATPPVTTTSTTTTPTTTTTTPTTTTTTSPTTPTTVPPVVGAPVTGGGPLGPNPSGTPDTPLAIVAALIGVGTLGYLGVRRIRARRS